MFIGQRSFLFLDPLDFTLVDLHQEKWPRPKGFAADGHWFFIQMVPEKEENLPEIPSPRSPRRIWDGPFDDGPFEMAWCMTACRYLLDLIDNIYIYDMIIIYIHIYIYIYDICR